MKQGLKKRSIAASLAGVCTKSLRSLLLGSILAAAGLNGASAANSLTYQGVTFNSWTVDSDTMGFSMLNATAATGDWAGIQSLAAFGFKNIGEVSGGTVVSGPGNFSFSANELNAKGCEGGSSGGACFFSSPPVALSNSMTWNIDFSGTAPDFSAPALKIEFLNAVGLKQGSLLSQPLNVSPVSEPKTIAMLLAGLGLIGIFTRRRNGKTALAI